MWYPCFMNSPMPCLGMVLHGILTYELTNAMAWHGHT
ncbi:hypothetical protein F383_27423 [Gossypium arboreum]|uniref:Uncharacterized protein n=1 Tax=Gossypium arboreum TaxID=29729 RepID=A0A0B0P9E8_GOSAR|nr:hypothetical protein F383_27423 [Gossypium arboreum]